MFYLFLWLVFRVSAAGSAPKCVEEHAKDPLAVVAPAGTALTGIFGKVPGVESHRHLNNQKLCICNAQKKPLAKENVAAI